MAKRVDSIRGSVQIGAAILTNSYFLRFMKFCPTPGLNCYACPLASFACPLGSLQRFLVIRRIPYAMLGFFAAVGAAVGRASCGWLCPFGLIQDCLAKLGPRRKLARTQRYGWLRYVFLIGVAGAGTYVAAAPLFCRICPAGTMEAGIPWVTSNAQIRMLIGPKFWMKISMLAALIWAATRIKRPFCRFICPLGAVYSPFNRISAMQLQVDGSLCNHCGACKNICPVDLEVYRDPNSDACIRCLNCTRCPAVSVAWNRGAGLVREPDVAAHCE
ncbi:MAG: 4Fe-4S binding protein [Clostridia bacterium]|nr:4Fe-4S binding protein [Clostridia bacterium]